MGSGTAETSCFCLDVGFQTLRPLVLVTRACFNGLHVALSLVYLPARITQVSRDYSAKSVCWGHLPQSQIGVGGGGGNLCCIGQLQSETLRYRALSSSAKGFRPEGPWTLGEPKPGKSRKLSLASSVSNLLSFITKGGYKHKFLGLGQLQPEAPLPSAGSKIPGREQRPSPASPPIQPQTLNRDETASARLQAF